MRDRLLSELGLLCRARTADSVMSWSAYPRGLHIADAGRSSFGTCGGWASTYTDMTVLGTYLACGGTKFATSGIEAV